MAIDFPGVSRVKKSWQNPLQIDAQSTPLIGE
jgi:hypothetical protein